MDKILHELDDLNWVFAMAFMAYIDPNGEYFANDIWLIYLGNKHHITVLFLKLILLLLHVIYRECFI